MDFRSLCSKLDVDSIRARLPHLPALPPMPHMKMPKSVAKLKSRKIFRRSREDVDQGSPRQTQAQRATALTKASMEPPPMPMPHADFINRTPTRISTITSLMQQTTGASNTYRRASSIDDDDFYQHGGPSNAHGSPRVRGSPRSTPGAAAPVAVSPDGAGPRGSAKLSLGARLQRGYRDLADFRLKHILAKSTVVRRSTIEVDQYVQRYDEDRAAEEAEQTRRDRAIADDYTFRFKESRQNTGRSDSFSPMDSPVAQAATTSRRRNLPPPPPTPAEVAAKVGKSVSEQSGDESGMETTPPKRVVGPPTRSASASARRRPDSSLDKDEDDDGDATPPAPRPSALWAIKERTPRAAASDEQTASTASGRKSYKERVRRLTNYRESSRDDDDGDGDGDSDDETATDGERRPSKQRKRRRSAAGGGGSSWSKQRQPPEERSDNPLNAIRQNLKRIKSTMSTKRQPAGEEQAAPEAANQPPRATTTSARGKLAARLRRFGSREAASVEGQEVAAPAPTPSKPGPTGSPLHSALANKLQTWKKSFKKRPTDSSGGVAVADGTGDEASPQRGPSRPSTLIRKLQYIRSRKNPHSTEDLDDDDEDDGGGGGRRTKQFEEKLEHARRKTMKKVNSRMQKMKIFHKSHEQVGKKQEGDGDDAVAAATTTSPRPPPPVIRVDSSRANDGCSSDQAEDEDEEGEIEEIRNEYAAASQKVHTVWTTRPILSDSTESDDDAAVEYPRVLIHQDNSDLFESTLIIAVTTAAASRTPSPSPKIIEIPSLDAAATSPPPPPPTSAARALEWIPNSDIVSGFLDMTPPSRQRLRSRDSTTRGRSADSNSNSEDSDAWIPEHARARVRAANGEGQESQEAWRVRRARPDRGELHKAKSIDIFETSAGGGGAQAAFEDFDDHLRNEPVVRIASHSASEDGSFEKDSSEDADADADAADDDNSSRVTKIRVEHIREEEEEEEVMLVSRKSSPYLVAPAAETGRQQIGNSRESLEADRGEAEGLYEDEEDEDDGEDDEDDGEDDDDEDESEGADRPPSAAPSPPPSVSPPPPPLPQRQPSMRLAKPPARPVDSCTAAPAVLPPLPAAKPPPPPPPSKPPQPPRIPERTESMARIAKPLVKTASLRLAYTEQVKPGDIGKVNKLISRFEHQPSGAAPASRPRVLRRTGLRDDSTDLSDGAGDGGGHDSEDGETTPTPTATMARSRGKQESIESEEGEGEGENESLWRAPAPQRVLPASGHGPAKTSPVDEENNRVESGASSARGLGATPPIPKVTMDLVNNNSNNTSRSRPNSEYGSPSEYPSSLVGSAETTPTPGRREQGLRTPGRRQRSAMARDDDQFFSFDSDEENSYYSVSSTGSRHVVEI